jgi:transcription elongation factor GreA
MASVSHNLSLGEAANHFLADLAPEERGLSQPEIYKFIRWFGGEQPLAGLMAAEVANYAQRLSQSDTDYIKKLELIRTFLVYSRKKGWSKTNLAAHLKAKKGKTRQRSSSSHRSPEAISLTQQGYAELEAELATLRSKRVESIDEIRKAAADKDFRENAPLEAAREQHGKLEGRIMELEATLKSAVVIDEKHKPPFKIGIGDSVTICDLNSGKELRYMLVSPREVDPAKGKISRTSPLGQALTGKKRGDVVEVMAPVGKLRYQIEQVEH